MNRRRSVFIVAAFVFVVSLLITTASSAYWVWTPETKKFINPKYAVKDTPKEQYDWAMSFYNAKDYKRAATEFDKLTKNYEYSEFASKSQYYAGLSYENMGKYYIAFQNYQKTIDNYPHIENTEEIIAREFNIGNIYMNKQNPKVLGTDIMTPIDRAVEIYRKVVDNAPFGKLADEAQFKLGEALKKAERYDEAMGAFQKLLDDYPGSALADKARYEVANSAYKASLKPAYDAQPTAKAIEAFEDFAKDNKDQALVQEAEKTIKRLKDKAAEKSILTAQFYERIKRNQAAIVYYQDVLERFPDSTWVVVAKQKIEALKASPVKREPLSALWPWGKEKKEIASAVPPPPPEPLPAGAPEGQIAPPAKKGWFPFGIGKKAEPEPPAPPAPPPIDEATGQPIPEKKGWFPFFGAKKAPEVKEGLPSPTTEEPKEKIEEVPPPPPPAPTDWTPPPMPSVPKNAVPLAETAADIAESQVEKVMY